MYLVLINSFRKKKKEKFILGREISPGKNFLLAGPIRHSVNVSLITCPPFGEKRS